MIALDRQQKSAKRPEKISLCNTATSCLICGTGQPCSPKNYRRIIKAMIEIPISIRSATAEDAQQIHELHLAAVRTLCAPHYAPEVIEGWLANRSAQGYLRGIGAGATIVAELASNVVGFGEGVPGEVVAVFVDPDYASRGIGSALLEHTLRLAHEHRGAVRLESTLNAVGFYERFGFSQVERSVVRRNRVEIPIVVMQRHAS